MALVAFCCQAYQQCYSGSNKTATAIVATAIAATTPPGVAGDGA
jgi:hypothetical protein